jgi:hypothetical protein
LKSAVGVVSCVALLAFSAMGCSRGTASTLEATALASAAVASPAVGPTGDAAATRKPFGEHCVEDAECAGGVCFHKRLKGPDAGHERRGANEAVERDGYCSMKCEDDGDCPVPPTKGKCGARGMCKRAE